MSSSQSLASLTSSEALLKRANDSYLNLLNKEDTDGGGFYLSYEPKEVLGRCEIQYLNS